MAIERGYVYVLTNPSMPGLVKVGKTTTTPSQRMSELHATGVPTPFVLEFSVETPDCHQGERSVHQALSAHRVAANREFFKVSVKHAVEHILVAVDDYEIADFNDTHGVEALERRIREKREADTREANEQARRAELGRLEEERARRNKIAGLRGSLAVHHAKLAALGPRPVGPDQGALALLSLFFLPLPFGWVLWIGALAAFSSSNGWLGGGCVALFFAGAMANDTLKEDAKAQERINAPFKEVDAEIASIEQELKSLNAPLSASPSQAQMPRSAVPSPQRDNGAGVDILRRVDAQGDEGPARVIGRAPFPATSADPIASRQTGELVKVWTPTSGPPRETNTISCPTCTTKVGRRLGQIDFKCPGCGGAFRY